MRNDERGMKHELSASHSFLIPQSFAYCGPTTSVVVWPPGPGWATTSSPSAARVASASAVRALSQESVVVKYLGDVERAAEIAGFYRDFRKPSQREALDLLAASVLPAP